MATYRRDSTMSDWIDDDDLTEPTDGYDRPLMGVTGGQRARPGDTYTLTFEDNGEQIETEQGTRVAFDATLESASFAPVSGDQDPIDDGEPVRFMTGSSRFLSELKGVMPVAGKTIEVGVVGTGYDSEYNIEEAD